MKKMILGVLAMIVMPHIVFAQGMYLKERSGSVYDSIPNGYRVFSLPLEICKLKGIQQDHRVDVFATFKKKEKISALLGEMRAAQKSETLGAIPLVFKTDADEEYFTILLMQNIKVLYVPVISSDYALDYPEIGVEAKADVDYKVNKIEAKEKQVLLARNAIIRLLLTPEESQLAAHAVATDMKLSLVIRNSTDTELRTLEPVDVNTFKKGKK